ncbi:MAG: TonB-dependent receptor, partial [Gammaproteobacteria bacterium]
MPIRHSVALLTLASLVPIGAQGASAQPIVVTATRLGTPASSEPANVTVITARDIADSTATTLPQLLSQQAGVVTRSLYGNDAARASVGLRGFGATDTQNTLILLNGRRLNDIDLSAVDFAAIPLHSIKRIEIIRGGGGVLYGDGAVGGAINIITRKGGRAGTRAHLDMSLGSFATRTLDADASHTGSRYSLHVAGQAVDSDGYRANNELQQRNVQADLKLPQANGEWFLRMGGDSQRLRLPGPRTVDPSAGINQLVNDRRGTATPNDWARRTGDRLSGGYSHYWQNGAEAVLDVGYRTKNEKAFFDDYTFGGKYARYLDSDLSTWSFTPRLTLPLPLFGHSARTVLGVDYYDSRYTSDRSLNPSTIATPVHHLYVTQKSLAAYGRTRLALTGATALTAGARLERVRITARDHADPSAPGGSFATQAPPADRTDNVYLLDLGLHHRLRQDLSVYLRSARSVRLATIDELFQTDPTTFLQVFSPLKPQTSVDVGSGVTYTPGKSRFSADVYYLRLRNEIAYDPNTFANVNLDPTRRYGLELSAAVPVTAHLKLQGSYAYMRAQFRDGPNAGNNVPLVPRQTATVSARWKLPHGSWVSAGARYVGAKYFDNDQTNNFGQQIPAYTLVDLKVGRRWHQWSVTAAVHNLFD